MARYRITTPEQVHFHYEMAGLMTRAMAWVVDQVILWALRLVVFFSLARSGYLGFALICIGIFLVDFGYYVWFEFRWAGQTPGKRRLGIRVKSARGGKLRFADVMMRNLMRPLDTLPYANLLGGVVAFLDPLHRRLGDMVAETLVVRDARVRLPEALQQQQSRVNTFQMDPATRNRILARVTREERDLILDLVARRDALDPTVREELFGQAAGTFRTRYGLPEGLDYLSDEQTVVNLALVIQGMKFTG